MPMLLLLPLANCPSPKLNLDPARLAALVVPVGAAIFDAEGVPEGCGSRLNLLLGFGNAEVEVVEPPDTFLGITPTLEPVLIAVGDSSVELREVVV